MPRSLRAFCVQLKDGEYEIARSMHVKAIIGVRIPQIPEALSQVVFLEIMASPHNAYVLFLSLLVYVLRDKPAKPVQRTHLFLVSKLCLLNCLLKHLYGFIHRFAIHRKWHAIFATISERIFHWIFPARLFTVDKLRNQRQSSARCWPDALKP